MDQYEYDPAGEVQYSDWYEDMLECEAELINEAAMI
jgi:hypothetical protein